MNGKYEDLIKDQQHQIEELREKILMERLDALRSSVHRVEEIAKKTYDQAMVTNGRVTKLEDANLIDRLRLLEHQVAPLSFVFRHKKSFITSFFILYIIAISPIGSKLYYAIVELIGGLRL